MRIYFYLFMIFALCNSMLSMDTVDETPENSLSLLIEEEETEKKTKELLFEYAIKELMERYHEEKNSRRRHQYQKYFTMGLGIITTVIPLCISILQAHSKPECNCNIITPDSLLNNTF